MNFTKVVLCAGVILCSLNPIAALSADAQTNTEPTGVGLAEHCLTAYRNNWQYSYGSATEGYVDCSGLIWSYYGVGGIRSDMLAASSEWGYVANGIPHIHGLGLHQPGHVGVYIGSNQAVDARDYGINCVLHDPSQKAWVEWFKIAGVDYPTNGWVTCDGNAYLYENGEYLVDTERTIDGVTYYFNNLGVSNLSPTDTNVEFETIELSDMPEIYDEVTSYVVEDYVAEDSTPDMNYVDSSYVVDTEKDYGVSKYTTDSVAEQSDYEAVIEQGDTSADVEAEADTDADVPTHEQLLAEQEKQNRIEQERIARLEKERIAFEKAIEQRRNVVEKRKGVLKMQKLTTATAVLVEVVNSDNSITLTQALVVESGNLKGDLSVYNIGEIKDAVDNLQREDKLLSSGMTDVTAYKHLNVSDSVSTTEAKTEYIDILYSAAFQFMNECW